MKFIILIICLILQIFLSVDIKKNKYYAFNRYASGMKSLLAKINMDRGVLALIGLIFPILILILLLNLLFRHIALLYIIYGLIVLYFCLDIQDMKKQLGEYFTAISNGNLVKAQAEAEQFVGYTVHQDKNEMNRAVTEAIFLKSLTNIFSVIFWFMVLGPFGAVLYYTVTAITTIAHKPEFGYSDTYTTANFVKEILDWLPVRILTLTFALIGHFGPVFSLWVDRIGADLTENRQMIIDAGLTAINAGLDTGSSSVAENQQAINLITRTLWTWVIIIGVLTVTSWL